MLCVAFNAKGDQIVTGGADNKVCVWDVPVSFPVKVYATTGAATKSERREAMARQRAIMGSSRGSAVIAEPSPRHLDVLAGLLIDAGTGGNLVADAHLAAIALAQGATVVTFDTDFARFRGVESEQPTAR